MEKLGNPHEKYKTIHVAGTNGKGSVSHLLSAVLQSAGYKTGLYTSPHLTDFGERIRVDGKKINHRFVIDFVDKNKHCFETIQPSFFEATMAMAFDYFASEMVDIAIIEVGLGGRLDSTNIIQPVLSVITNIGFDHTDFLGDELTKIASEKAGIIKQNTPVIVSETHSETQTVFIEKAKSTNAKIRFADQIHRATLVSRENDVMHIIVDKERSFQIGLLGDYQLKNVVAVLTSIDELRMLDFLITENDIKTGFKDVIHLTGFQGRWQIIRKNPTVILDTGHNKEGIQYVAEQLVAQGDTNLHIVFGMADDKDISGVLGLLPTYATYYFTEAQNKRALSSAKIQSIAEKFNLSGDYFPKVKDAVQTALNNAGKKDLIFIGGSNFVVGESLQFFTE